MSATVKEMLQSKLGNLADDMARGEMELARAERVRAEAVAFCERVAASIAQIRAEAAELGIDLPVEEQAKPVSEAAGMGGGK